MARAASYQPLRLCQFESETQTVTAIKTYTKIRIRIIVGERMIGDRRYSENRRLCGAFVLAANVGCNTVAAACASPLSVGCAGDFIVSWRGLASRSVSLSRAKD